MNILPGTLGIRLVPPFHRLYATGANPGGMYGAVLMEDSVGSHYKMGVTVTCHESLKDLAHDSCGLLSFL